MQTGAFKINTSAHIKLDERNHVEKPLLDQLAGLGWEIIDLDSTQRERAGVRVEMDTMNKGPLKIHTIGCGVPPSTEGGRGPG